MCGPPWECASQLNQLIKVVGFNYNLEIPSGVNMKVTQLKEMLYNQHGELQEMKYTQSLKRVSTEGARFLPAIQNENLKAIANQACGELKADAKSMVSGMSRVSKTSKKPDSKMGVRSEKSSSSSSPPIVHYDFNDESKTSWMLWAILLLLVIGLVWFWPAQPGRSQRTSPVKSTQQRSQVQQSPIEEGDARNLVSLYIDELLAANQMRMSLGQFKSIMTQKGVDLPDSIWNAFYSMLSSNPDIRLTRQGNETIGVLSYEPHL